MRGGAARSGSLFRALSHWWSIADFQGVFGLWALAQTVVFVSEGRLRDAAIDK
jgi:hypothetical protein